SRGRPTVQPDESLIPAGELRPLARPANEAADWRELLQLTAKDKIVASAANVATVLRHDRPWRGVLEYDERLGVPRFACVPPFTPDLANPRDTFPREVTDADLVRIQAYLSRTHDFSVSLDAISAGLDAVASQRPRDPVREYLDSL